MRRGGRFKSFILCAAIAAVGCGRNDKGGGGSNPGDQVAMELSGLFDLNQALQDEGREPLWRAKLVDGSEQRLAIADVSVSQLKDSIKALRLSKTASGKLELTAYQGKDVLATNVKEVAYESPALQAVWDEQCEGGVSPDFSLRDAEQLAVEGQTYVRLNVQVCDFVGLLAVPTMKIEPQQHVLSKLNVVYKCQFNVESISSFGFTQYADTLCDYGYETMDGELAPSITVPVEFAPNAPHYEAHRLKLDDFKLSEQTAGRKFHLSTDFFAPAFGSNSGCYRQDVDLYYDDGGVTKQARAHYKLHVGTSGEVVWVLENEASLPGFDSVVRYYQNAAPNSRMIKLYRFCEWSPEAMGIGSDDVAPL